MGVAALAAVYAAFDVLLGVIPGTAGIGHEDGEQEAGNGSTGQHTHNALEAEDQTHNDGGHDADDGGQDHLVQGGLGAEVNAAGIVRIRLAVHQADDLLELTTNLYHDGLGGTADRLHGECGKDEGQAGADEQADQYNGGHHREVIEGDGSADLLNLFDVGSDESQSGEGSRADGEALTGGGGGVAEGVKRIGALTNLRLQAGHFGDTAGVIGNGAVGIGGQGDAQRSQHADSRQRDAVKTHSGGGAAAGNIIGDQDADRNDDDGQDGGQHAQAQTADHDGGGAGQGGVSQTLGGLVGVAGEVLGGSTDENAGNQTGKDGKIDIGVFGAQYAANQEEGGNGNDNGAQVGAAAQCGKQGALIGGFTGADKEGADDGGEDTQSRHDHGQGHGLQLAAEGGNAQRGGGNDGADIALVEVGAHAGHVAYVIAYVIGNNGGVAGVVLGDARFDLTDEVSADIGSLGVDTAADTGEQRHGGSAHTKGEHGAGDGGGVQLKDELEQGEPDGNIQKAQTDYGKAHNGTGRECHAQTAVQAGAAGIGGAAVGLGGDAHADEAGKTGEEAAGDERKGYEPGKQTEGSHGTQDNEHAGKENGYNGVLALQIGVSAFTDGCGNFLHQRGAFLKLQDLLRGDECEHQRDDGAEESQENEKFLHLILASL